jgi:hypothetical protein
MRGAMERSVRVNAEAGNRPDFGLSSDDGEWEPIRGIHGQWETRPITAPQGKFGTIQNFPRETKPAVQTIPRANADEGPCLYLGPAGQRCDRRATKACFCAAHQPKAPNLLAPQSVFSTFTLTPKKIAAFFIALAMLWPEIAKAISALIRLFR